MGDSAAARSAEPISERKSIQPYLIMISAKGIPLRRLRTGVEMAQLISVHKAFALILLTVLALIRAFPLHAVEPCQGLADSISHGQIMWAQNAIVVQGTAVPNLSNPTKNINTIKRETQRAATLDAYRKAAEVLAGVMLTSDATTPDQHTVMSSMRAFVQQPSICKSKFYSDGGVDMVVMVPLQGELITALLPSTGAAVAQGKSVYTGIIVDATELPFRPALAPRFLSPDGSILFSHSNVRASAIKSRGMIQYVTHRRDIDPERIGSNPLTVKAVQLGDASPSELILESRAASALRGQPAFLADGNIAILTSPIQPVECADLFPKVVDRMIDWERQLVIAKGHGKVDFQGTEDNALRLRMMERAAEVDAQRHLLKAIMRLATKVDPSFTAVSANNMRLQGWVRNAVRCGAKYYRDGSAEVVLAAPVNSVWITGRRQRESRQSNSPQGHMKTTGVIIDASGFDFKPALSTTIMSADQTVVVESRQVARAYRQTYGMTAYHSSLEAARANHRLGAAPLVIDAVSATNHPSQVMIARADAVKLKALADWSAIQHQGRIAILTQHTVTHLSD